MAQTKLSPTSPGRLPRLATGADPVEAQKRSLAARLANPGSRAVRNTKIRRLRALRIVEYRAAGWSNKEIATELRISGQTVAGELQWADKNGLIEEAEQRVMEQMLPKAFEVIMRRMETADDNGLDLRAATNIVNFFKEMSKQKAVKEGRQEDRKFDLAKYLADRRAERGGADAAEGREVTITAGTQEDPAGLLSPHSDVVDAEVVAAEDSRQDRQGAGENPGVHDPPAGGGAGLALGSESDSESLV